MDGMIQSPTSLLVEADAPRRDDILDALSNFGDHGSITSNGSLHSESYLSPSSVGSSQDPDLDDVSCTMDHSGLTVINSTNSNSYSAEWARLFEQQDFLKKVREYGIGGQLRSCRFRSVCWKLFLEVLPGNIEQWVSHTRLWRNKYEDLKQMLVTNPRSESGDLNLNNPLSQDEDSPWNQFFQDNELRVTIKQDVIRTYPKIEFYHTDLVRSFMVDILFVYAKLKPDISYRQIRKSSDGEIELVAHLHCKCWFGARKGVLKYIVVVMGMHELLAPLIFVLHCDHQAFLHACEIETVSLIDEEHRDILKEVMDPDYIEHDAYAMFFQIMETVEPWYVSKEISPPLKTNSNILHSQPFSKIPDLHPSNVIVTKLTRIQDYLLRRVDPELHAHLTSMDIVPQIYGIRWVRLLFGREFPMQDLLMLWDAIFADGISFDLVDYIFVAMLLYIRDAMLVSDYPSCLHLLMKFPPVGDVHYFIDKANFLREPSQHHCPPSYIYQKPGMSDGHARSRSSSKDANVLSSITRRISMRRPKSLSVGNDGSKVSRSSSEPMNLITDAESPGASFLPPSAPTERRKGSTASMSKIEGMGPYRGPVTPGMRSATSTQSLATAGISPSQGSSPQSVTHTEDSGRKFNSLSRVGRKAKKSQDRSHELVILLARLSDLDYVTKKCAEKMDTHIRQIQAEVMRQELENEDELLLALAGLKQVRDVLKGSLKPSSIFDGEEMRFGRNHTKEHSPALNDSSAATPATPATSLESQTPDRNYIATPDLLSDNDLASPEDAPRSSLSDHESHRSQREAVEHLRSILAKKSSVELGDISKTNNKQLKSSETSTIDVKERSHSNGNAHSSPPIISGPRPAEEASAREMTKMSSMRRQSGRSRSRDPSPMNRIADMFRSLPKF